MKKSWLAIAMLCAMNASALMANETVDIFLLSTDVAKKGIGEKIGTITIADSDKGLEIKTDLKGLKPGEHGFHVHEKANCEGGEKDGKWTPGLGAGSHLDPDHSGHHLGPNGSGHLGDLPFITANDKGESKETLVAKRLKVKDLKDRSLMIHQGGDNYSDNPPMGGGGDRIACGVVK